MTQLGNTRVFEPQSLKVEGPTASLLLKFMSNLQLQVSFGTILLPPPTHRRLDICRDRVSLLPYLPVPSLESWVGYIAALFAPLKLTP
jgi:hypothetical protein